MYHYVNFIPLLFGKNKTIEFRCHVPTTNIVKVLNWLYICSAIIKFAERMSNEKVDLMTLRNISLKDVMLHMYDPHLAMYLVDYISARKHYRMDDELRGDFVGSTEIYNEIKDIPMFKDIS